ncbi:hypothetical protein FOA43_000492 [Brettanomyces nanus]|uniref:Dystroglycan-type cadherin-like domain-containing protein n=1 Tax=Eeniella nana TaxID=13502 RepID=A0A875RWF3_EENNA|nr:uncharacterized protein FOA43_000492 [Brettanomyces nanus]QPG73186.1 hypothetical protein FOA43_000492 [Brettanomyces nanus]
MFHVLSFLYLVAHIGILVTATPIVGLPFNEQLPDVARVGEDYYFALNSDTIESDNTGESVTYSASGLPSWLTFDATSLVFTGTAENATNITFTITGTDSTGSVDEECQLVVSEDAGPRLTSETSLYEQLAQSGNTNGYDGIVLQPNEDFSIKFDNDTFEMGSGSGGSIVSYYGRSANRTSLPIWCQFDDDTLTFSGTAPTVNAVDAPSQEFDLVLIATDYIGYTGAYGAFHIVVGGHYLISKVESPIIINATAGKEISQEIPIDSVYLDGQQISSTNISSVDLYEGPSWVSISDNDTLAGTVPDDILSNTSLNVTVTDIYGDSIFISFDVDVLDQVFAIGTFPEVNATRGEFFKYTIDSDDLMHANSTNLTATYEDANWLNFYYSNNTFNGWVPKDFESVDVTVNGTLGDLTDSREFTIEGIGPVNKFPTNDTLSNDGGAAAGLVEENMLKLDGGSASSVSSSATDVDSDGEKQGQMHTPYGVITGDGSNNNSSDSKGAVRNSWRKNSTRSKSNWKPRDSLTSLATVTTNDLLTMNVVDDPSLQRRSQMNLLLRHNSNALSNNNLSNTKLIPSYRNSRVASIANRDSGSIKHNKNNNSTNIGRNNSSDYFSSEPSSNIELLDSNSSASNSKNNITSFGDKNTHSEQKLAPIRDFSGNSGSTGSAKLMDFQDRASIEKTSATPLNTDNRSYHGVIE